MPFAAVNTDGNLELLVRATELTPPLVTTSAMVDALLVASAVPVDGNV